MKPITTVLLTLFSVLLLQAPARGIMTREKWQGSDDGHWMGLRSRAPQREEERPVVFSKNFERMKGVGIVTKPVFTDAKVHVPKTIEPPADPTNSREVGVTGWIIALLCFGGLTAAALRILKLQRDQADGEHRDSPVGNLLGMKPHQGH